MMVGLIMEIIQIKYLDLALQEQMLTINELALEYHYQLDIQLPEQHSLVTMVYIDI